MCAYSGKLNGTNNARLNKFKRAVTQIQGKRCHKTVLKLSNLAELSQYFQIYFVLDLWFKNLRQLVFYSALLPHL